MKPLSDGFVCWDYIHSMLSVSAWSADICWYHKPIQTIRSPAHYQQEYLEAELLVYPLVAGIAIRHGFSKVLAGGYLASAKDANQRPLLHNMLPSGEPRESEDWPLKNLEVAMSTESTGLSVHGMLISVRYSVSNELGVWERNSPIPSSSSRISPMFTQKWQGTCGVFLQRLPRHCGLHDYLAHGMASELCPAFCGATWIRAFQFYHLPVLSLMSIWFTLLAFEIAYMEEIWRDIVCVVRMCPATFDASHWPAVGLPGPFSLHGTNQSRRPAATDSTSIDQPETIPTSCACGKKWTRVKTMANQLSHTISPPNKIWPSKVIIV